MKTMTFNSALKTLAAFVGGLAFGTFLLLIVAPVFAKGKVDTDYVKSQVVVIKDCLNFPQWILVAQPDGWQVAHYTETTPGKLRAFLDNVAHAVVKTPMEACM